MISKRKLGLIAGANSKCVMILYNRGRDEVFYKINGEYCDFDIDNYISTAATINYSSNVTH